MTSSEQARADAMADAMTLTDYITARARDEQRILQVTFEFGRSTPHSDRAADLKDARVELCPRHYGLAYALTQDYLRAAIGAHKAFCAVPALRGED